MAQKKTPAQPSGAKPKSAGISGQKKSHAVSFYHDWCKECGLCMAFCPKKIIRADKNGKPVITNEDLCTGCRFCEMHCPDFAITVEVRTPRRRKTDE
ncbi:MAG: 4Fe-4S binding protein [Desulfobulbaceae bacterium]|nr:4Fe-4S binding protein [Desulfobulbaceae bacterium]